MGLIDAYTEAKKVAVDLSQSGTDAQKREWERFTYIDRLAATLGVLNDHDPKLSYSSLRALLLALGVGEEIITTFLYGTPTVRMLNKIYHTLEDSKAKQKLGR